MASGAAAAAAAPTEPEAPELFPVAAYTQVTLFPPSPMLHLALAASAFFSTPVETFSNLVHVPIATFRQWYSNCHAQPLLCVCRCAYPPVTSTIPRSAPDNQSLTALPCSVATTVMPNARWTPDERISHQRQSGCGYTSCCLVCATRRSLGLTAMTFFGSVTFHHSHHHDSYTRTQGPLYACLDASLHLLHEEGAGAFEVPQAREFLRETIDICFLKLMCSKAVTNWDESVQRNILDRAIQVIHDPPLQDLLQRLCYFPVGVLIAACLLFSYVWPPLRLWLNIFLHSLFILSCVVSYVCLTAPPPVHPGHGNSGAMYCTRLSRDTRRSCQGVQPLQHFWEEERGSTNRAGEGRLVRAHSPEQPRS